MRKDVSIIVHKEPLYFPRHHTLDEGKERALCPPQCPEGRNFESLAGESEGERAPWADCKNVGGDP